MRATAASSGVTGLPLHKKGDFSMRTIAMALGTAVLIAAQPVAAQTPPDTSPCFQVIAGQPNVPPGAPVLVDRCSGDTFVLVRAKGRNAAHRWVPLSKSNADSTEAAGPASPRSRTKAAANCFSYNGRSYCP